MRIMRYAAFVCLAITAISASLLTNQRVDLQATDVLGPVTAAHLVEIESVPAEYALTAAATLATSGPIACASLDIDPAKVIGRDKCAECHKSEMAAWIGSSHNEKAFAHLSSPTGKELKEKLGDLVGLDAAAVEVYCGRCHGTPRLDGGEVVIDPGNSCESCHGGASDWLDLHADYGKGAETMEEMIAQRLANDEDPAHRAERLRSCFEAGMNRSEDVVAIVQNCLECHATPFAELAEIGHPTTEKFEVVAYSQGEVRHNFLLDPNTNAESPTSWTSAAPNIRTVESRKRLMFVAGQLGDLEFSLRIRAGIEEEGDYLDWFEKRLKNATRKLKKIADAIEDAIDDGTEVAMGQEMIDLYEEIKDNDDFDDITDEDEELYTRLADLVRQVAVGGPDGPGFLILHRDGDKLPEDIEYPEDDDALGDVFNP